eukprot:g7974.t1
MAALFEFVFSHRLLIPIAFAASAAAVAVPDPSPSSPDLSPTDTQQWGGVLITLAFDVCIFAISFFVFLYSRHHRWDALPLLVEKASSRRNHSSSPCGRRSPGSARSPASSAPFPPPAEEKGNDEAPAPPEEAGCGEGENGEENGERKVAAEEDARSFALGTAAESAAAAFGVELGKPRDEFAAVAAKRDFIARATPKLRATAEGRNRSNSASSNAGARRGTFQRDRMTTYAAKKDTKFAGSSPGVPAVAPGLVARGGKIQVDGSSPVEQPRDDDTAEPAPGAKTSNVAPKSVDLPAVVSSKDPAWMVTRRGRSHPAVSSDGVDPATELPQEAPALPPPQFSELIGGSRSSRTSAKSATRDSILLGDLINRRSTTARDEHPASIAEEDRGISAGAVTFQGSTSRGIGREDPRLTPLLSGSDANNPRLHLPPSRSAKPPSIPRSPPARGQKLEPYAAAGNSSLLVSPTNMSASPPSQTPAVHPLRKTFAERVAYSKMWEVVEEVEDDAVGSVAMRNYLHFQWTMFQLFAVLSVVNFISLLPVEVYEQLEERSARRVDETETSSSGSTTLGFSSMDANITNAANTTRLFDARREPDYRERLKSLLPPLALDLGSREKYVRTYVVIVLTSVIALAFIRKYVKSILVPLEYSWTRHCSRSTVLLRGIPRGPRRFAPFGFCAPQHRVEFAMTRADLDRVASDLRDALAAWFLAKEEEKKKFASAEERSNFEAAFYDASVDEGDEELEVREDSLLEADLVDSVYEVHQETASLFDVSGSASLAVVGGAEDLSSATDINASAAAASVVAAAEQEPLPQIDAGLRREPRRISSQRVSGTSSSRRGSKTRGSNTGTRGVAPGSSGSRGATFTMQLMDRIERGRPPKLEEVARKNALVQSYLVTRGSMEEGGEGAQQEIVGVRPSDAVVVRESSGAEVKTTPPNGANLPRDRARLTIQAATNSQGSDVSRPTDFFYRTLQPLASPTPSQSSHEGDRNLYAASSSSSTSKNINYYPLAVPATSPRTTSRILAVHVVPSCDELLHLQRRYADLCGRLAHYELLLAETKKEGKALVKKDERVLFANRARHVTDAGERGRWLLDAQQGGEGNPATAANRGPERDGGGGRDSPAASTRDEEVDYATNRWLTSVCLSVKHFLALYWLRESLLRIRVRYLQAVFKSVSRELLGKLKSPGTLSGLAFVTFRSSKDAKRLLRSGQFSFGRPPFQAITLECSRSPAPSDIFWANVHVTPFQRVFVTVVLVAVLFSFLILLVTPVVITPVVLTLVQTARERFTKSVDAVEKWAQEHVAMHARGAQAFFAGGTTTGGPNIVGNVAAFTFNEQLFWTAVVEYLPVVILLFINSVLVPFFISCIARLQRGELRSDYDVTCLRLNLVTTSLNSVLLPLVGFTSLQALVDAFLQEKKIGASTPSFVVPGDGPTRVLMRQRGVAATARADDLLNNPGAEPTSATTLSAAQHPALHSTSPFIHEPQQQSFWVLIGASISFDVSGAFTLRYLINATFLTAATQLTQVSQILYRRVFNAEFPFCFVNLIPFFTATTPLEKEVINTPWAFDWGYWYAWSAVILFQALFFSVAVPVTPVIACLCYYIKYRTDKYNLFYQVYSVWQEEHGVEKLLPQVVQMMLLSVAMSRDQVVT